MQARSALFDLYGDYLRSRGGQAPVAALVRLLAPLRITAPAVRTAISRMVAQGWLVPVRASGVPGYQLTAKALHRLDEAAARIYRTDANAGWDGTFDLVVLTAPSAGGRRADRANLARLSATLAYLGYGRLDETTWVAPRAAADVDALLRESGADFERFRASHSAGSSGAASLVRRAWDLAALAEAYTHFVADQSPAVMTIGTGSADQDAYATRFGLVHAWRGFLFRDPQLPPALLPKAWPGTRAAEFFDHHEARLRPAADRFVDSCISI